MRVAQCLLIGVVATLVTAAVVITAQVRFGLGATTSRSPEIRQDADVDGLVAGFGAYVETQSIDLTPAFFAAPLAGLGAFVWQWRRTRSA